MVRGGMRTSDTRVMRGADVYSDHYLVRANIRLKLARNRGDKSNKRERFDMNKLKSVEIRKIYNLEVKNRFHALENEGDSHEKHDSALDVYTEAAKQVIGKTDKKRKPWISEHTWRKVEERKESKQKLDNAISERLKERWKEGYDNKNREVKRGAREDISNG